jgi:hypothetical protein
VQVKLLTETIVKTIVEPRRLCFSLPSVYLRKRAIGGVVLVTVVSASSIGKRTANEVGNHRSSSGKTMSGIASNTVTNIGRSRSWQFDEKNKYKQRAKSYME